MQKIAILSTKVTPCESCGAPSTTMLGGQYLCESCSDVETKKIAEDGSGIPCPFKKSLRQVIDELS
jgi:hypothetical protein